MNSMVQCPPWNANRCSTNRLVTSNYEAWRHIAPHNNSLRYTFDTTLYIRPKFLWTFHLICAASTVHFIPQVLHHMLDPSEPSVSRPAQGCALEARPVLFSLFSFLSMWLSSADWLSWGKWNVRALSPRFLYVLRCMCLGLVLKFWFDHHRGSFFLAGPDTLDEQTAPPWLKLREGYAGVRAGWWGKVRFWSLYS